MFYPLYTESREINSLLLHPVNIALEALVREKARKK